MEREVAEGEVNDMVDISLRDAAYDRFVRRVLADSVELEPATEAGAVDYDATDRRWRTAVKVTFETKAGPDEVPFWVEFQVITVEYAGVDYLVTTWWLVGDAIYPTPEENLEAAVLADRLNEEPGVKVRLDLDATGTDSHWLVVEADLPAVAVTPQSLQAVFDRLLDFTSAHYPAVSEHLRRKGRV